MRWTLLGLLAISGISFWFLLGFPFAHHNESYIWATLLHDFTFRDALTERMTGANPRPLSTVIAWFSYKLSGEQIWPAQLFNFLVTVTAWLFLFRAMKEKKAFSLIALAAGSVFFAGYVFLFHVHGICYSPVVFLVGMAFLYYQRKVTTRNILGMLVLAVLSTLSHPFASLIYLAYAAGVLVSNWKTMTRARIGLLIGAMALVAGLTYVLQCVLAPDKDLTTQTTYQTLLVSYRMLEANIMVSAAALGFAIITALSLNTSLKIKIAVAGGACALGVACKAAGMPVLFAWVAVCLLKTLLQRQWSPALMIVATFCFPAASRVGSPTYGIFLVMVCTAVTAMGWTALEMRLAFLGRRTAAAAVVAMLVLVVFLRLGVTIPGLSTLAGPLLAEREKTFQLEKIIDWMMGSKYSKYSLVFWEEAGNPTTSDNALNRTYRPPTFWPVLNYYMNWLQHKKFTPWNKLIVAFGSQDCYAGDEVYRVKGKFAGDAVVYLSDE